MTVQSKVSLVNDNKGSPGVIAIELGNEPRIMLPSMGSKVVGYERTEVAV